MLLDARHRGIASSSPAAEGATYPLQAEGPRGFYRSGTRLVPYALTPGYETYRGFGWYGCIETQIGVAVEGARGGRAH